MMEERSDSPVSKAGETGRERRGATILDGRAGGRARPDIGATLHKVVEMVRRITRADTAAVGSFSYTEGTVTWKATSGFQHGDATAGGEITTQLRGEVASRAARSEEMTIVEGIAVEGGLDAAEFPLHSAEGVRDLALVPLRAREESLGALVVGYRTAHKFTAEEKQLLEGLAEMAALALDNARLFEIIGTAKRIWEQTFDAIPDGIIVHDDQMRIARCNREAAELMGVTPAETIGMPCADAFARLFGERAAAYHMRQPGVGAASSFELQAEGGRRYLVSVAPLEVSETRANWSVITWSDITELSEIQEQLARSRRLATVGQLAAGVAHEINNPLATITACAEATLRGMRKNEETARLAEERRWDYYLEEIVRQALRGKAITRGLLDLSRQRRARREACDINQLVERSVRLFEQREHEKSVVFTLRLDSGVGEVATDETMLRQILDNLLSNALDAIEVSGQVGVATLLDGERVVIEVSDDGAGITPEALARIFDPFFTTKDPGKGSGLGLAISLTLAEAIGGALTVESRPAQGSRFRLWIPKRTPEKEQQS
jgi:two-component system NtrC family sensor kinase